MIEVARFFAVVVLVPVFLWAGAVKLLRPGRWREALGVYRLPSVAEPIVFVAAPIAELAVAVLILAGATKAGGALAVALLCGFCAALLRARSKEGDRLPCGCFGGNRTVDYRILLARNLLLLVPALLLLVLPNGSLADLARTVDPLPVVLIVVGALVIGWTAFEVARALTRGRAG